MAIIGFCGTPGSGKTYDAVRKIIDNLQKGRVIFTNIDGMEHENCLEMIKIVTGLSDLALTKQLHFFEPDQLEDFWNHISPKSLIVLDEVQKIFSSREWQTKKNNQFGSWASTHRHHGHELILITQNPERIDSSVRSLFEWCYVYRKVNFFGSAVQKKYLRYSYAGDDTNGSPLKKDVKTYNPLIFSCYKSYISDDIQEQAIMNHVNVLKHPVFFAIPAVFIFTLWMFFSKSSFSTGDMFGTKAMINKEIPKVQTVQNTTNAHTPNINQYTKEGRLVFSNRRIQNGS